MLRFDLTEDLIDDGPPIVEVDAGSDEADFSDHVDQNLLLTFRLARKRRRRCVTPYSSRHHWIINPRTTLSCFVGSFAPICSLCVHS
jgi:hypothetical protein